MKTKIYILVSFNYSLINSLFRLRNISCTYWEWTGLFASVIDIKVLDAETLKVVNLPLRQLRTLHQRVTQVTVEAVLLKEKSKFFGGIKPYKAYRSRYSLVLHRNNRLTPGEL